MGKEVPRDRKVRLEDWWCQLVMYYFSLFNNPCLPANSPIDRELKNLYFLFMCTYHIDQTKDEIHISVENICTLQCF